MLSSQRHGRGGCKVDLIGWKFDREGPKSDRVSVCFGLVVFLWFLFASFLVWFVFDGIAHWTVYWSITSAFEAIDG